MFGVYQIFFCAVFSASRYNEKKEDKSDFKLDHLREGRQYYEFLVQVVVCFMVAAI